MQRKRFSEDIYRDERRYLTLGWSDQAILEKLVQDYGDEAPTTMRAVRRHLAELRTGDDSGRWSLHDAPHDEIRIVLDYYRESAEWERFWPTVTKLEAAWMARLSEAGPGLSTYVIHALAREYIQRYASEDDPTINPAWDLDAWLAFKPWEDGNEDAYNEALETARLSARSKEEPDVAPKRGRPVIPQGVKTPKGALGADFFMTLTTARFGPVKGEDNDAT